MSRQMDMFKYPKGPGYKEQTTSRLAAEAIAPIAETLRAQALEALRRFPMTADETARRLGVDRLAIRPRISELSAMGLIRRTGAWRKNIGGKWAAEWTAVKADR